MTWNLANGWVALLSAGHISLCRVMNEITLRNVRENRPVDVELLAGRKVVEGLANSVIHVLGDVSVITAGKCA